MAFCSDQKRRYLQDLLCPVQKCCGPLSLLRHLQKCGGLASATFVHESIMSATDKKQIDAAFDNIHYDQQDPSAMRAFISLTAHLHGSVDRADLVKKFAQFLSLKQPAAKATRWNDLCRIANRVHLEADKHPGDRI